MNRLRRARLVATGLAAACGLAAAAPLDALLDATPLDPRERLRIEVGYDVANRHVDFLKLRASDSKSKPGDYRGEHFRVIWQAAPAWTVEGSLWQRAMDYQSFDADVLSWQLAGQWQLRDGAGGGPALALRLGAWGNSADELKRRMPVKVEGVQFETARVTQPRDRQLQLDLVASWQLADAWRLHLVGGAVASQVDFDSVDATTLQNGCLYQVAFGPTSVVATCESPGSTITVTTPNAVYGIDVSKEARYRSTMAHLGVGLGWRGEAWRWQLGVKHAAIRRSDVDDIIARRGGTPYRTNTVVIVDGGYRFTPMLGGFVRAEVMSNQFNGETPMSYNSVTANRFGKRYGILTLGLTGHI